MKILSTGTDRSEQTVKTLIRLLQKEQSDQGLHCLLLHLHLLNALLHYEKKCFNLDNYGNNFKCPNFQNFMAKKIWDLGNLLPTYTHTVLCIYASSSVYALVVS